MWSIYSQNIEKRYFAPILSRAFFVSVICYIMAFILPALILVSIGYSMNDDSKVLLQSTVKYQNYQISCLLKDKTMVYDSSFVGDDERTFKSSVAVGTDGNMFSVSAFVHGDVMACTLLTYNKVLLNVKLPLSKDNYQVLTMVPFSFYRQDLTSNTLSLSKVTQKGKLQVFSSSSLSSTSIPFIQTTYPLVNSIIDNSISLSTRNLSAFVNIGAEKRQFVNGAASPSLQFTGNFEIQSELFVKQESLINKIRSFVPFYMYIWFPIFFFIIVPVIQWMFSNRLYYAKCDKGKVKVQ